MKRALRVGIKSLKGAAPPSHAGRRDTPAHITAVAWSLLQKRFQKRMSGMTNEAVRAEPALLRRFLPIVLVITGVLATAVWWFGLGILIRRGL